MTTETRKLKVLLVGEGGVGKTSFVKLHCTGEFEKRYVATMGVEVSPLAFHTSVGVVELALWDTAGQKKFAGLREAYYIGADAAIIMFDVTVPGALSKVAEYYQAVIRTTGPIPVVVCGNKADCSERRVTAEEVRAELGEESGVAYYDLSVRSRLNFAKPMLWLVRQVTGDDGVVFTLAPGVVEEVEEVEEDVVVMESRLAGRTVFITGASSGIGRFVALHLAKRCGMKVIALARRVELLESLVAEIGRGRAVAVRGDVTSIEDVRRGLREGMKALGVDVLDVAFLNAGLYRGQVPVDEQPMEDIDVMMQVNVYGVLHGLKVVLPELRKAPDGVVIVTSSTLGHRGNALSAVYSATKAFVRSLVETTAAENAGQVRVNSIEPGVVFTDGWGSTEEDLERAKSVASERQLIKRPAEGQEVGEAVEYLAGAGFVTGCHLGVDGGGWLV